MADALAVVKVGNSECEFLKFTPLSRISAIAGAVCGLTMPPRKPSGINRMRLWGLSFWARTAVDGTAPNPTLRIATHRAARGNLGSARRIKSVPPRGGFG